MEKIALLFPGQGSQYIGMGKSLFNEYAIAKEVFEEANDVLEFDIKKLCFEGNLEELTRTENTQPALLTVSMAAYKVYMKEIGIVPKYMAGHSLGEFTALTASGVIKFDEALRIVKKRGKLMQESVADGLGSMYAISGMSSKDLEEYINELEGDEQVVISCYNSLNQNVISGESGYVSKVAEMLNLMGAKVAPVKVSAAFHSQMMKKASNQFALELIKYKFEEPFCSVISNVTAQPYKNIVNIVDVLSMQMINPVRWDKSIDYLLNQGVDIFIELGPKNVLKNLMKLKNKNIATYSLGESSDVEIISKGLNNRERKNIDEMTFISKCIVEAVCSKNNNWNNEEYQDGVIEPYRKTKQLYEYFESNGKKASLDQLYDALNMLKSVLKTKKVPDDEQKKILEQMNKELMALKELLNANKKVLEDKIRLNN